MKDGKIWRIAFLSQPEGNLTPIPMLTDEQRRLSGFDWKAQIRPASETDIFRRPADGAEVKKQTEETGNGSAEPAKQ